MRNLHKAQAIRNSDMKQHSVIKMANLGFGILISSLFCYMFLCFALGQ